jgi:secreted trypsin-like serine protease
VVDELHVLTAAHCVTRNPSQRIDAVLGSENLCAGAAITGERIAVDVVELLPGYEPASGRGDVAMLTLGARTSMSPVSAGWPPSSQLATAFGWGSKVAGGPALCDVNAVEFEIAIQTDCPTLLKMSSRAFDSATMLCAVPLGGASMCFGNSGAPLIGRDESDRPVLLGLLSSSPDCAGPAVFARVDSHWGRCTELLCKVGRMSHGISTI